MHLQPWSSGLKSTNSANLDGNVPSTDAQRQGVTQESLKAATRARQMTVEEAEKILGIDKNMNYEEVLRVSF